MKILICAHPDDEALWFNPKDFDKIIFCFCDRPDNYDISKARLRVLEQHPLKEKIVNLGLIESGYVFEQTDITKQYNQENAVNLKKLLKPYIEKAEVIYTHNSWGEYLHPAHISVYEVVMEMAQCPVWALDLYYFQHSISQMTSKPTEMKKIDLDFYFQLRDLYQKEGAWTWHKLYEPKPEQPYYRIK